MDGGYLPVAVVDRILLSAWLETCDQAGLTPAAVVPDSLLLPWQNDEWSVLLEARRALVRTGRWEGFATERDNLALLLAQALAEAGETKPRCLRLGAPATELAETEVELRPEDTPIEPLALFASDYQPATVLNLLQGGYSRQAHWGRWLQPWRGGGAGGNDAAGADRRAGVRLLAVATGGDGAADRDRTDLQDALAGGDSDRQSQGADGNRLRELAPAAAVVSWNCSTKAHSHWPIFERHFARPRLPRRAVDLALEGGDPAVLDRLRQQFERQPGLRMDMRTTQQEGQMESKITVKRRPHESVVGNPERSRAPVGHRGLGLTLALLGYALVWEPFRTSHRQLQQRVAEQRADLIWMRQAARRSSA